MENGPIFSAEKYVYNYLHCCKIGSWTLDMGPKQRYYAVKVVSNSLKQRDNSLGNTDVKRVGVLCD